MNSGLNCNTCKKEIQVIGQVRVNSAVCITCYAKELEKRIIELENAQQPIKENDE